MLKPLAIPMDLRSLFPGTLISFFFFLCIVGAALFIRVHLWHFGWVVVPTLPLDYLCHTW